MNTQRVATTHHKRVNVTLPEDTIRLLDRMAERGERSGLVDRAVHFYVKEVGRAKLRQQLRQGAAARASRDLSLAEEWFLVDEGVWKKPGSH